MDRDEVARRLEEIRAEVRAEISGREPALFAESVREDPSIYRIGPSIRIVLSRDPDLTSTADLGAANDTADILAFEPSHAPVVGPAIDLLRRLTRPLVKLFLGSQLTRQQQFNAHAVRHLNELGHRLEARVRGLEEALAMWTENPGGIDGRVRGSLEDYDAALRQRHMTMFSALEEEVLVAHNAMARLEKLEQLIVERAQGVDARFDEKDAAIDTAMQQMGEAFTAGLEEKESAGIKRLDTAASESRARDKELSESLAVVESQMGEVMALRSMLRTALEGGGAPAAAAAKTKKKGKPAEAPPATEPSSWSELGEWMGDEDYRSFQDRFRGDPEAITERMREHVGRFDGAPGIIADLGCGRGEFLDLLAEAGMDAVGVEINAADVEACRKRGHEAVVADLFAWLEEQDDGGLGGIFMAQVIEHLPPTDWQRFVELGARKLAAGGRMVVETINPESLYALAPAYVIDPTHIRPVHPELLAFLARRAGLHPVEIHLQSPVPDDERPTGLPLFQNPAEDNEEGTDLEALKEALVRLDRICCAPQEYSLAATRPALGDDA